MYTTFRQLRLFLALADTGSVSAAARVMHVTQPTASMQLRKLSESVGLPLFEVISRKVHLTPIGREFAKTARNMANEWEAFEQEVYGIKGLKRGRLNLAVVSTAKYLIPRLLGTFCVDYPEIDIALVVLNRDGILKRLEENMDDLYIMSRPPLHVDIEDQIFMPNPLVLISSTNNPLARKKRITLSDIQNERFISRERGSGTRLTSDEQFKRLKFKPNIRLELGSNEAIKQAVIGNLGVAVLSVHSIGEHPEDDGVAILRLKEFPIESNWHIVYTKGKKHSPIAKTFKDHLISQAKLWKK